MITPSPEYVTRAARHWQWLDHLPPAAAAQLDANRATRDRANQERDTTDALNCATSHRNQDGNSLNSKTAR